jgi:hypothetical protein
MLQLAGERAPEVRGDGGQYVGQVQRAPRDLRQGRHAVAERLGRRRGVEVHVQADTDQVGPLPALAQQAGELATVVEQVVGPLELNAVVAR